MRSFVRRLALIVLLATGCGWVLPAAAQQRIIYDHDCSQDNDCVVTLPILYRLADRGEIEILAMVADSANPYSAPVFRVFAKQAVHPEMPIGANQSHEIGRAHV